MNGSSTIGLVLPILRVRGKRAYPPRQSVFTKNFWNGLADGRWQTSRCGDCSKQTFPPKPVCPHCWSDNVHWSSLSDKGKLYSWTRIHAAPAVFAHEAPYAVGIVDLNSGIRLACRLFDIPDTPFKPEMLIEIVVLQFDDGPLFAARPLV